MSPTIIDRLHTEYSDLLDLLEKSNEPSLRSAADDSLRKALLLASASYFEKRMTDAVLQFVQECTSHTHVLPFLVKSKVISRQYHTWFDWNCKNANTFFKLFGQTFSDQMKEIVNANEDLKASIAAFMEVGSERNRLVHQDFGSYSLEKTTQEVFGLYSRALAFVDWFPAAIREYADHSPVDAASPE
jgi:hypothetical protein